MSSWPNTAGSPRPQRRSDPERESRVLRGDQAAATATARLDGDLRGGKSRVALSDEALAEATPGRRRPRATPTAGPRVSAPRLAQVRAEAERSRGGVRRSASCEYAEALQRGLAALAARRRRARGADGRADVRGRGRAVAARPSTSPRRCSAASSRSPTTPASTRCAARWRMAPANRPVVVRLNPTDAAAVQATLDSGAADVRPRPRHQGRARPVRVRRRLRRRVRRHPHRRPARPGPGARVGGAGLLMSHPLRAAATARWPAFLPRALPRRAARVVRAG